MPLVAGWVLLVGTWYVIYDQWYRALSYAFENLDYCNAISEDDDYPKPPDFIKHLINVVFVFLSSFGFVNLAYVIHSFYGNAKINYKSYELCYIILSFVAKATLILWCMSSVFKGGLAWLKGNGCADSDNGECVTYDITRLKPLN